MSRLEMRLFSTTIFQNKSVSDAAQIPAPLCTVDVYKQGATVANTVTVTSTPTAVAVYSTGRIIVGDLVQVGTDPTQAMSVVSIDTITQLTLQRAGPTNVALGPGARLLPTTNRPNVFQEPSGTLLAVGSPTLTTDSQGQVSFYVAEFKFDYIVSGAAITTVLFPDGESGWSRGGGNWVNVKDFPTIQAAIDHVTTVFGDGTVFIPGGMIYDPTTTPKFQGIVVPYGVSIVGENTTLSMPAGFENTDMIQVTGSDVRIRGLRLQGPGVAGSGCGINVIGAAIQQVVLSELYIFQTASWAINMLPNSGGFISHSQGYRVTCYQAASGGSLQIGNTTGPVDSVSFVGCAFNGPPDNTTYGPDSLTRGAVHISQCNNIGFTDCTFEPTNSGTAVSFGSSVSNNITFTDCHFETNTTTGNLAQYWITHGASGGTTQVSFRNCGFYRHNTTQGTQLLKSGATGSINAMWFRDCYLALDKTVDTATDDVNSGNAADCVIFSNIERQHSVSGAIKSLTVVNATTRPLIGYVLSGYPDWSFRLPGIADHTAIVTPVDGMIAWNKTDHTLRVYVNGAWKTVTVS